MSAGGSGAPAAGAVSSTHLLLLGLIGGLVLIYLGGLIPVIGPVLAAIGAVLAIVWGADAIRRVASYGLGTGVPSIGYMSVSIGILGVLAGLFIANILGLAILSPILIVVIAMIIGLIVALVAKKLIGMKIPIMERCTVEIAGAAALSVLGFSTAIAGTVDVTLLLDSVVGTGFIAVLFILCTMAIQHPFNACLGPNEDQLRTLKCACSTAFLSMFITGFLAIYTGGVAWVLILIVGFIGWYVSFNKFVDASCDAAASVKWAGLWPKLED